MAKDLGMTVEFLLSNISSRELTEWSAAYILDKEDEDAANRKAESQAKMRR